MEFAVFSMFRVDIRNLVKNRLYIAKDFNIQPSEIARMPYYEYEFLLEDIKEFVEEEKKRNKEQEDKYGNMNPSSMLKSAQKSIPSIKPPGGSSSFKMPKVPKL